MDEFIDLCILCGCDFTKHIRGVGPVKAFKYIKEKKTIEEVLKQIEKDNLKKVKYVVPEDFKFEAAREIFKNPDVNIEMDLKWKAPDEEGLIQFLVEEKGFNKENCLNAIAKLKKSKSKANQGRLDSFFGKKAK